jgi:hypothetical protein
MIADLIALPHTASIAERDDQETHADLRRSNSVKPPPGISICKLIAVAKRQKINGLSRIVQPIKEGRI